MSEPLLEAIDLVKTYRLPRTSPFAPPSVRPALAGVSFRVMAGSSFGIVGEFGIRKVDFGPHCARARQAGFRRGEARGSLAL